ncbi:MAG TPA: prepilin-type N-terminal cleavage/methylation domain-containing protein [Thermoanaerobaculia bacterium]|nr:prepilin-type N-terminal cleavage/methylation domain-containing protein [Thermoanaerobaculia bacterium]
MNRRLSTRAGFTLIELLIVVAIIGIIASMLIPNMLDAMQKAKQKRTMADMRIAGGAMFSWLTDQVGAAAAGQTSTQINLASYGGLRNMTEMTSALVPTYLQDVPVKDGWKSPYDYYLNTPNPHSQHVMAIRSRGRNKQSETDDYTVTGFEPTDYDQDVVWADGFMVRWPEKH